MSNNLFTNVHYFDGKLTNANGVNLETIKYSDIEKINKYNILKKKLTQQNAIRMITIIESGNGNYQQENNLDASDLLVNILYKDYDEILPILEEQLSDMFILGQCPSGRVTRLVSILISLTECSI